MSNIIKTIFADQRKPLDAGVKEQVRGIATEAMSLLQQINGMEQQVEQLKAAYAINATIGNQQQATDQIEQQMRMLDTAINKGWLLLADKLGMKV